MQLYQINQNGNRFCGPSVISAIAGIGTKEAAAIIRAKNGKESIKGTHGHEVRHALNALGFMMTPKVYPLNSVAAYKRVTLRQWAKFFASGKDVFLVAAGNHWILLQGRYAMCSKTLNLVPIADHPHARCFVADAYRITQSRKVDPAAVIPVKVAPTDASARRKAVALAKKHGIEAERESGMESIWVSPPDGLFANESDDPFDDEHYCGNWNEALERVQKYVEVIKAKLTTTT